MKKSSYFYLSLAVILLLSFGLVKHLLAADCPIETVGLSRDTYNDLKDDSDIVNEVKALQTIFSKIPNIGWQSNYQITGNFGFGTEALLRRFQKAYKLNSTGVLDQATIQKLCEIWAYQNKVYTPSGTTARTTEKTSYQQKTTDGTQYQQQTNETAGGTAGGTAGATSGTAAQCVHKICAEPGFCKDKNTWCCIYYQEFDWKPGEPCVDECESDQYCVEEIKKRNEAINDPRFAYDYKECYRYKCDNNTYTCKKVFDTYVKKDQKCPAELNPSLNKCTPPDIGCKQTDIKKCGRGKCYLIAPTEKYKYECGTQTLNVPLDQPCPASECQHQAGDGVIGNPMSQDCERLYGAWKNLGGYCYVGKCDSNTHKCNTEKVYPDPGKTCDDYPSECANHDDCLPKPKSDYYFDSTSCECKEDSSKGKLTQSECELKKAEAIQKQEGGCKGYQTSEDWLKTIDCSLGNYTGSQPEFECGQKLGCKWCPECIYESTVGGEHNLPRGDQTLGRGMFTGYPGGKCIKINETCVGAWVKGRCGAQCSVPQGKTVSDKNPIECTTGSYWGDKWAENNCDDPKTCEAVCLLGRCEYTDKNFREGCALAKTQTECEKMGSCAWVYECRGQQLDGPYRPTWYYVGNLTINTCVPASWYSMTDYTYKCVKGKCGAECDDDSDCGPGSKCTLFCKCASDCIGDSDLGDPLVYGECRNGLVKSPSDYVWKDSCNGPKILIEATLTDKENCGCGHQTFDCSQILVNGTCKDGKCVSSTEGKKTYCGCQNFQKICKIEEEGGGNIGEKIECRPGDTSICPSCRKSCDWAKCEEKTTSDWRCKSYYKEVSKEEQCPESDPSCIDRVNNKPCTPPKCTDFTGYRCLTEDKCDSNFKKTEKYDCTGQTVCCKEKTTTPTKCTDFVGYSCLAEDKCAPDTKKTDKYDCTGQTVCCKEKTPATVNYSKCDKTSYTSLGIKYWTYACSSTSNPDEDDGCVGKTKTKNELVEYCTNLYGPLPPPSTSTLSGCLDNKPKISVERTYCDYSNCSNLSFNYQTIVAFIRNIIAGTTPPVQTGKCVKTGQYIEVCPEKADEVRQCKTNTDCLCPTGGETCSSKYPGYQCVSSPKEICVPDTSKGSILDCQLNNKVCCKSQVACWQLNKACLPESQCQPNSIEALQHGCESGLKCCKEKTTTTGQWCESCSNLSHCTRVKWYDSDGGCDDNWYNQRTTWADDSCESYYPCDAGQHCQGGVCTSSGTTAKCSNYSGHECLSSSDCKSGTSKGQLDCGSQKVCCQKETTTTAKCSDYSGHECLNSSECESGTDKGQLDCGSQKVCCKKKTTTTAKCSDYSGYQCLNSSECESGTSKGNLDCSSGRVCCKLKTPTCPTGYTSYSGKCLKDCSRCSTSYPCQWTWWKVEYPHSCDENPLYLGITPNYKNDDSCGGCPTGKKCSGGICVGTGL